MKGLSRKSLIDVMIKKDFDTSEIDSYFAEVDNSPIFQGAISNVWHTKNLETILNVRRALHAQDISNAEIPRRSNLTSAEFHKEYYSKNKPVIIEGLLDVWPAYKKWTPEYFSDVYGNEEVEIQSNRKTDPVYDVFLTGHATKMKMREFCEKFGSEEETNDYYLTANDRLFKRPEFKPLWSDFWGFEEYFKPDDREGKQFLWMGPKGAVSPLHRDKLNVFMTQVYGRKKVLMISSDSYHHVYNFESFYSKIDAENPDLSRFPLFGNVKIIEVVLEPGDSLLIPVGWWHHVRSLTDTINISLTNFKYGNEFTHLFPANANSETKAQAQS
jgi:ribosomal protein L16 Arg81 hydroxylase